MSAPAVSVPALAPAAAATAPPKAGKARSRRSPAKRLLPLLALLLLVGAAYGLAKAGVLPVSKWAGKNPAAQKALAALGLAAKTKTGPASAAAAKSAAHAPAPVITPAPAAAALPSAPSLPTPTTAAERQPPKDNAGRLARIMATMEPAKVAGLFSRMPDAEVAPLLLKMKESTAGEILSALPTARAVTLTGYLRRYQQP